MGTAVKTPKSDKHVIFLDKNHPPSAIPGAMKAIKESMPNNYEVKIVALTPKSEPEQITDTSFASVTYPINIELFARCLKRVGKRSNHETLNGANDPKKKFVSVLFMF